MFQISQGVTSSNDWVNYSNNGIYVDVDISACGFTKTPHYIATLEGNSRHWGVNGASSIYSPTPNGFRIYIRGNDDNYGQLNPLRIDTAQQYNWHIKWSAIQACPCER